MRVTGFLLLGLLMLTGCKKDDIHYPDITGEWVTEDLDMRYMELSQSGAEVTGNICAYENKDCLTVDEGTYKKGVFTFHYQFGDEPTIIDCSLEADVYGLTLSGTMTVRGKDQIFPVTYSRK